LAAPVGDDRVIPKIWEVDATKGVVNKPFGVRILYNGGTKTTLLPYQYEDTTVSITTENQYLYCGHLDSVTAPTFDLSFGVPIEIYYNATTYTNANLFNLYHKKYVDEISDPDSKVVTGYFYLTPKDIAQLDFRNKFYFENQYFRLNKIYDYNPIDESVTKCEFIKIKEGRSFSGANALIFGGFTTGFLSANDINDFKPIVANPYVAGKPKSVTVLGNGNVISGQLRNSYINGDYNYVHGGENINLLGSSGNTIYDGLQNVTLINTSGTIVSSSNTMYINGYEITSGTIASLSGAWSNETFNAANFYHSGIGTFTVELVDVENNRYSLTGKTMKWILYISTGTFSGTVTNPKITIPNGKTIKADFFNHIIVQSAATYYTDCYLYGTAGNNYINIVRAGGTFANATDQIFIAFNTSFEIE
jgi:hypothetical protein